MGCWSMFVAATNRSLCSVCDKRSHDVRTAELSFVISNTGRSNARSTGFNTADNFSSVAKASSSLRRIRSFGLQEDKLEEFFQ